MIDPSNAKQIGMTSGSPSFVEHAKCPIRFLTSNSMAQGGVSAVGLCSLTCKTLIHKPAKLPREITLPIFYTPSHAEEVLPEIRTVVERVMATKNEADVAKDDAGMTEAMNGLEREVRKLEELGCVVRDMGMGLVDFPAVRLGERVWLCWKLGEDHVSFWHTRHEGFSGRKPIEAKEFYDDDLAIRSLNGEIVSKANP